MEWSVENNLVCPTTGTAFALTSGAENLKFILWYKGDYFLRTGSVISPEDSGVLANGKKRNIKILHVFPLQQCVMGLFS
ncbi:anti-adapter protein IraM [Citrobacter koseri]|uniref:Anti-adapter protein IraM n=1 Tax=Citrobacter koseri TaxID=545 RepID=A0A2X2UZ10_CITKO|nr:anti-adapter protein IraM [Citrobacter koseri]